MRYASLRQGLQLAICPSINGGGAIVPDLSGQSRHATLVNMDANDYQASAFGRVLDFDGIDDALSVGGVAVLPTERSVSIWVYQRSLRGLPSRWFSLASEAFVIRESGGSIDRYFFDTSNTLRRATSIGVNLNQWQHYVLTFNGTNLVTFRNGIPVASDTFAFTPRANTGGVAISASSEPLDGQIDDIRLYSRVLTLQEIRLLASEPGIGFRPERTSVFFGSVTSSRRRKILTGQV